jgi:hypothetical protein
VSSNLTAPTIFKIILVGGAGGVTVAPAMKTLSDKAKISGLTLVELLVLLAAIVFFFAMFLPTNTPKRKATLVACLSNQRQIALGFTMWKEDHGKEFPWDISATNNGTMESSDWGNDAANFNAVDDYIKQPRIFVCPTDAAKTVATNDALFHNQNISYFVALDSGASPAVSILTGDRHLRANQKPVKPGLFVYSKDISMDWTLELHGKVKTAPVGVASFVDGHGEIIHGYDLNSVFLRQGSNSNRLDVP